MSDRKDLSPSELNKLARKIKIAGGKVPKAPRSARMTDSFSFREGGSSGINSETRNVDPKDRTANFNQGKIPSLTNIYLARMSGKIEREEAEDLNPNYQPERLHVMNDKYQPSGKRRRTQAQMFEGMIKHTPRYKKFLDGTEEK